MKIFNNKTTKEKRKILRKTSTEAEKKLWELLRSKRLDGHKFFRQYGIGHYIADFYCPTLKLAIELDGAVHLTKDGIEYDKERDEVFRALKIKTVRFKNHEVMGQPENIIDSIRREASFLLATPSLLKRGNGGV